MGFMLAICFHSVCALHHGQILTAVHGLLWPLRCKLAARHTLPVLQSCGLVHCAQMVASATGSGNSSTIMRIFLEDLETSGQFAHRYGSTPFMRRSARQRRHNNHDNTTQFSAGCPIGCTTMGVLKVAALGGP